MTRNLGSLIKKIYTATSRIDKENALLLYRGEDWKEHIQYGKRFELQLLQQPKLMLIGLKKDEKTVFTKPTLVKVLGEEEEDINIKYMDKESYLISEKQLNFLSLIL